MDPPSTPSTQKPAMELLYNTKKLVEPLASIEYETEVSKRLSPVTEATETNHENVSVMYDQVVKAFNMMEKRYMEKWKENQQKKLV